MLTVTTESISFTHDYGWFKTSQEAHPFDNLGIGFDQVKDTDGFSKGKMMFWNYADDEKEAELIYETTVLIDKESVDELKMRIEELFEDEDLGKVFLVPFSSN